VVFVFVGWLIFPHCRLWRSLAFILFGGVRGHQCFQDSNDLHLVKSCRSILCHFTLDVCVLNWERSQKYIYTVHIKHNINLKRSKVGWVFRIFSSIHMKIV